MGIFFQADLYFRKKQIQYLSTKKNKKKSSGRRIHARTYISEHLLSLFILFVFCFTNTLKNKQKKAQNSFVVGVQKK